MLATGVCGADGGVAVTDGVIAGGVGVGAGSAGVGGETSIGAEGSIARRPIGAPAG